MSSFWWLIVAVSIVGGALCAVVLAALLWRSLARRLKRSRLEGAKQLFHRRREWLEVEFLTTASRSGRPRGLAWADCDFQDEVSFARDRHTGQLCALVGVAIAFEAVEGGGMQENPNVESIKAGSAVFRFDGRRWTTDGRALLNLDPHEAIQRLHNELETVD